MTVQELIYKLEAIENKSKEIVFAASDAWTEGDYINYVWNQEDKVVLATFL